jgi:acetyltransferase
LIADYPQIREFDMNPLLITPQDGVVLDARAVVDRRLSGSSIRPFAHLAIRPYPEQYIRSQHLKDGTAVILRPIRPEDEPSWHRMLGTCSPDSLHSRFRYSFKRTTHEMATRYCFIDYEREMAIVAEKEGGEGSEIFGVGRLVADPNHDTAEYAVLVADPWQGKGLGMILTRYCLEIACSWGVKRIVAETSPDNFRMMTTFRELGFDFKEGETEGVVSVSKRLET